MSILASRAEYFLKDPFLKGFLQSNKGDPSHSQFQTALAEWSKHSDKPIVLLIDEIDALVGDTMVSLLRQLRAGYIDRPHAFPISVILSGVRDVRDYRIHASSEKEAITGGSAFNIKAESLRLGNFNRQEVLDLLQMHTTETGQIFEDQAKQAIWQNTMGQPWLVNALAYEITHRMRPNRDRTITLTAQMVQIARENLILRRETHLDQLTDKLQEPRVKRVIAPILSGENPAEKTQEDDVAYVYDLGLIERKPKLHISNPIYQEIIPRVLVSAEEAMIPQETAWFVEEETGKLQMDALLKAFQQFFRQNAEHWTQHHQYREAGPQLLLQAFLQRIVNGGGRIEREYGLGRGRTELFIEWPTHAGIQQILLELKINRGKLETTIEKALPQVAAYMDCSNASEAYLILFDHRDLTWQEKTFQKTATFAGHVIQVWGM